MDSSCMSPRYMWWSARNPPADPKTSFAGKTILVTGANIGLGFESTLKFAALGASRLILGVRSLKRGEAAKADICMRTGYSADNIAIYSLDMSTFAGVNSFASAVIQHETRVDIAVLNAGIAAPSHKLSPEGYEMSVQVNGLSTALLGALLLPKLRATSKLTDRPSYLEINGSVGHELVKPSHLDFPPDSKILDEISKPSYFSQMTQYPVAKLLNFYTRNALVNAQAAHGGADEVIITIVCPNLCRSGLGRAFPSWQQLLDGAWKQIMARSAEQGSRTLVSGVALGKEAHGRFWSNDVFFREGEMLTSEVGKQVQKRLWAEMLQVLQTKAGLGPL